MKKKNDNGVPPIQCKCLTCHLATLVQFGNNPLLAECAAKEKTDRQVARTPNGCPLYLQDNKDKEIIHYK